MKENTIRKVLVTGGAGYLGSVLVRELLARGYAVKVFDRLYFTGSGLAGVRDRIELIAGDVRYMAPQVLDGVDAVIHLAGFYDELAAQYDSVANSRMNINTTAALAFLCRERGVKRFVFASSCAVYYSGHGRADPDELLDERMAPEPKSGYARAKLEAENLLLAMADDKFCPVILRKGTLFGFSNRMRYDLLANTFLRDAMARGRMNLHFGGEMWRPMLEVRDAAKAYIACLEAGKGDVKGQVFNVAQRNYRVSELALHIRQAVLGSGGSADIGMDSGHKEVCSYRVSCEKIRRVLGFSASATVEESVSHMLLELRAAHFTDFDNAIYYNVKWIQQLMEAEKIISLTGSVFGPGRAPDSGGGHSKARRASPLKYRPGLSLA